MDSSKQQILRYFIEEAKEHLDTLEQGLLDLQSTMKDSERVNELFRAAHSVKGGAAMLGFGSIQKTSHRMEDAFKILKENPIQTDQTLEALFLNVLDILRGLLERLQGPFGLRDEEGEQIVQEAEPLFVQLHNHIQALAGGAVFDEETAPEKAEKTTSAPSFEVQVTAVLRQMLQLFKQPNNPANRQQLEQFCGSLLNLGEESAEWQSLVETAQTALGNHQVSNLVLAPLVIKELKQASVFAQEKNYQKITISQALKKVADQSPTKRIAVTIEPQAAAKTLLSAFDKQQLAQLIAALQKGVAKV